MDKIDPIKLIVGLGNPGAEYQQTRHNAGVWYVDALLRKFPTPAPLQDDNKFKGLVGQTSIAGHNVRILVPTTFMNLSGQSVAALANFYKIPVESILVAHDELDISPGEVRLKVGGGHGGHNGLRNIIEQLGNQKKFGRLRLGIGHPGNAKQVANFVLKKPSTNELDLIEDSISRAVAETESIVKGDWQPAMKQLHTNQSPPTNTEK
jgi:PTH1 family peptidyl-tRNA hydrolase